MALFALGSAIFTPTVPSSCDNTQIQATWDSIFKETFSGITIFTNTTQNGRCNGYLAYKVQGDKVDILTSIDSYAGSSNFTTIWAYEGNLAQDYINIIKNFSVFQNYSAVNNINSASNLPAYIKLKNTSLADASSNYTLAFEADVGTFTQTISSGISYYSYGQSEINATSTKIINGTVIGNYSLNYLNYFLNYTALSSCTSNWVALNTSCISDDSFITWYNDTASCGNATRPANITGSCDYDHNGIIGNLSQSTLNSISLDFFIDSSLGNLSLTYNTTKRIELREANITRVLFDYPFSSSLNFKTLTITKQPSTSSYGYLVVNGLNITKTLTIDKLAANSTQICVLNAEASISDITPACNSSREYLFSCPGSFGSYTCALNNSKFVVSGLTSSVVVEYTGQTNNTGSCTENWLCQNWTSCISGIRTRICNDVNNCTTTSTRPPLSETCTVTPATCKTNWSCSPWPTSCPSNGIKTRTCTDTNRCQSPLDIARPNLSETCTNETNWTWIIIITAIVLVIIIAIIYFIIKSNPRKDTDSYINIQDLPRNPPSSPQFTPSRPFQPQIPAQPRPIVNPLPPPSQPRPQPSPSPSSPGMFNPRPSGTNPLPAQPQRTPQPPAQSPPPQNPQNQQQQQKPKVDFEF